MNDYVAFCLMLFVSFTQGILYSMVQSNATTIGNDNNIQIIGEKISVTVDMKTWFQE